MGKTAAPHQLAHGFIVRLVRKCFSPVTDHGSHQAFRDLVCQFISPNRGKIPLQSVHQDVGNPAAQLVFGQAVGQFRVHQGESGPDQVAVYPCLFPCFFVGEHSRIAGLAPRRRDGQHRAYRQSACKRRFAHPDVPDVCSRHIGAYRHCLGRVDDTASSHRQDEIRLEGNGLLHSFSCQGQTGIGLYPSQFLTGNAFSIQLFFDLLQKAAAHRASSAVDQQHPGTAPLLRKFPGFLLGAPAKHDLRWGILCKTLHIKLTPFL